MSTKLPETMQVQCPGCGAPVDFVELRQTPGEVGYGLLLNPCEHLVTLEMVRDSWGIGIPDPDPMRVVYE